jgi:tetratricopeptide (TPR) repeat protein
MAQHLLVTARPSSPRRWAALLGRLLLLIGLLALTGWNVTRSNGLDQARQAYARGDLVSCLQRTLAHLSRRPWSREAALLAARCLSRLDFPDSAESYYHRAGPRSLDDLQIRAFGLVRGNHRQQAIQAYEEILARWPDNITALRRLAAVQLSENNVPQLETLADRLIQSPGGAAIGYTLQGVVAHNDRNYERAVSAFEHVLALDPELRVMPLPRSLFWGNLADDLIKIGRVDDVRDHLTKALASTPDAQLMNTLGQAHYLGGSFDEADRCFRQAADWEPTSYLPWLNLGKIDLQRHRFEAAKTHLETALKLMPRQADILYALVTVYRLLDRPADAAHAETVLKDVRSQPAAAAPRSAKDPWPQHAL